LLVIGTQGATYAVSNWQLATGRAKV